MFYTEQLSAQQYPLVNKYYKAQKYSAKAASHDKVWVLRNEAHTIVGACRLKLCDKYWLLTSLFVSPDTRGLGGAAKLLSAILGSEFSPIYTFALSELEDMYIGYGFTAQMHLPSPLDSMFDSYSRLNRALSALKYSKE